MTLPPLKLVLTAAGCPGASTLIRMLKSNGEREIVIHGVDMRPDAIGRFMCDGFSLVPPGASAEYIPALAAVVEREHPDLLFVQSSHEIETVARHRDVFEALGARVLADGVRGIEIASDKAVMHAACSEIPVPQPELLRPASLEEFVAGAHALGYPDVPVCFKPPVAKGSRGFRILSAHVDRVHELLYERPINRYMTLDDFIDLFTGYEPFPDLMLMEYVDAPEITVDLYADEGEVVFHQTRTREEFLTGLAMAFKTIDRPRWSGTWTWTTTRACSGSAGSSWRSTRASARSCTRRTSSSRTSASSTRSASSARTRRPRSRRGCAPAAGPCGTTTRSSGTTDEDEAGRAADPAR